MAYTDADKRRFAQLLEWGTDDDELRRFFVDSRVQLILKGGKVQNLPRGKAARIRILAQELPSSTDNIVRKWFAEHLTMIAPEPVVEAIDTLRFYEDVGESVPEDEARKLARSCLVHLFSTDPPQELLDYLRSTKNGTLANHTEPKKENSTQQVAQVNVDRLSAALARTLVALAEGKDPDEHLPSLSPIAASFVAGVHAVRTGNDKEVEAALEVLAEDPVTRALLGEYAARTAGAAALHSSEPRGLQVVRLSETDDSTTFDFDRDEVMAVCIKDFPETAVFVQPFAIRTASSAWFSLTRGGLRERIFCTSGDVIVFTGRDKPRQPKRGEIGLWRVAKNENSSPSHKTNFHVASDKTVVYDVRNVPFASSDYDCVREYIKHQAELGGPTFGRSTLFLLRDELIVGCPPGKDLTKNESFEAGLLCWTALSAIRFEGRLLVPGPLPNGEKYECEVLASSLRKLLANDRSASAKLTKAQLKAIQELIVSGEARLGANRAERLRIELEAIDQHEGATEVLLEAVMAQSKIAERIDQLVQEKVNAMLVEKEELRKSIEDLKREKSALIEERKCQEREQRTMAPAVSKAIRNAFDKARLDPIETLGQVAVFKALIDETIERSDPPSGNVASAGGHSEWKQSMVAIRPPRGNTSSSVADVLRSLGVTPKCAKAYEVVGQIAQACGLILVLDGIAARLAAEGWLVAAQGIRKVLECRIGMTDDSSVCALLAESPAGVAMLDANLSPLDAYATSIIDAVQQRVAGTSAQAISTLVVISLSRSVAALPIPSTVESISLRVELDRQPRFLSEADARQRIVEISETDEQPEWLARLWKPAARRVQNHLNSMSAEGATLALSVLDNA